MKLEDLLAGFDAIGIKNFDDFSVKSATNTLSDQEMQRQETQFEVLIHSLRPYPEGVMNGEHIWDLLLKAEKQMDLRPNSRI